MNEALFHIGIDFGTSQTKVCVQHTSARPQVHEFLQFGNEGERSFFLPSKVWLGRNGRLAYGHRPEGFDGRPFEYFKIVAAEDVAFRTAASRGTSYVYDATEYAPLTPELLSVFYLTNVLLTVRAEVQAGQAPRARRRGLLRRKAVVPAPVRFTVQLGFPTEYLSRANVLRKRKFDTILVLADDLASRYSSIADFREAPVNALKASVVDALAPLVAGGGRGGRLQRELDDRGLATYPESAAGLASLIRTGRLDPGHYAALDIGGGSTDLSFFRVNADRSTSYLASESVLLASNDVYRTYCKACGGATTLRALADSEATVRSLVAERGERALDDDAYARAIKSVTGAVHRSLYRVFNERVYWLFDRGAARVNRALGTYKDRPCFVYGGGGALPIPRRSNRITIHDNGRPYAMEDANYTWVWRERLDRHALAPQVDVRPTGPELQRDMALLAVAFGLSYPHTTAEAVWDEGDYRTSHDLVQVQHPTNEGMYVYDVVERAWR